MQRADGTADNRLVLSKRTVILLSVVTGVALELGIYALSGRREAWDSAQFWTAGLPLACIAALAIGRVSRGRDWLWTFIVAPSQVATMMVRGGEVGSLWPLALVLSAILSAPFVVAAFVGKMWRDAGLSQTRNGPHSPKPRY